MSQPPRQQIIIPRVVLGLCLGLCSAAFQANAQWHNAQQSTDQAKKLHAAHAVFTSRTQSDVNSLSALAQLRAHAGDTNAHAALLYAAADLPQRAEALISAPGNRSADPAIWVQIAQRLYNNGDYAATERLLLRMPPQPPARVARQRADLLARTLLRAQRYDDAALPLAALEQFGDLSPIEHYNLGIAWLGAGADAAGAGELNRLGRYEGDQADLRALANQSNLTLGYWLLDNQRAQQARQVLWRIPLDSALARKGLLALGWSEFLTTEVEQPLIEITQAVCEPPPDEFWDNADPLHKVPRDNCRIPRVINEKALLAAAPGYADNSSRFQRAAVAWQAAAQGGQASDPVVAEAMISLPYALVEAGDLAQAQAAYLSAVNALTSVEQNLAQNQTAPLQGVNTTDNTPQAPKLARLIDIQTSLKQLRSHLNQRIVGLASAPENRNAKDVADILNKRRQQTQAGASSTELSPVERGRLLLALSNRQDATAAARTFDAGSQSAVHARLTGLDTRISQTLSSTDILRQRIEIQNIAQQREKIRAYLRQAAAAFADLSQEQL